MLGRRKSWCVYGGGSVRPLPFCLGRPSWGLYAWSMKEIKSLQEYRASLVAELQRVDEAIRLVASLGGVVAPKLLSGVPKAGKQGMPTRVAASRTPGQKSREATLVEILKKRGGKLPVKEVLDAMRKAGYVFSSARPKLNWLYMDRARSVFTVKDAVVTLR